MFRKRSGKCRRTSGKAPEILRKRWLSDDKVTLHELAAFYGVSAERVRQIEKNAMTKIRKNMLL